MPRLNAVGIPALQGGEDVKTKDVLHLPKMLLQWPKPCLLPLVWTAPTWRCAAYKRKGAFL